MSAWDTAGSLTPSALAAAVTEPSRATSTKALSWVSRDDWTTREVTAPVPDDANTVAFGIFLVGPGRIELRDPELTTEN